jgi:hypothetical protein
MQGCDFDLKLSGADGEFFVELHDSPLTRRSQSEPLRLAGDIADRIKILRGRHGNRNFSKQLGVDLFNALLPPPLRDIWKESKGTLRDEGMLRLRLDIRAHQLTSVPWEIVHDGDQFLTLASRSSVVRYLFDNASVRPFDQSGPLNILLVTANPTDLPRLPGLRDELQVIHGSLANLQRLGKVHRLKMLAHATSERLLAALDENYDIIHFMGHGAFINNRGYLFFEDSNGKSNDKEAETFGDVLKRSQTRLLVLNACDTAIPSSEKSLIGVADAAHAAGVPAVVGMQQTILDGAATEFARAFYRTLAGLQPLEACLAAGRIAVKDKLGPDSAEWAIPVLFSNAPAGALNLSSESTKKQPPTYGVINANRPKGPVVIGNTRGDICTNKTVINSSRFEADD